MEFTYKGYENLIGLLINNNYKIADYHDCDQFERCVILRHDVDFSLEKALMFAEVEKALSVRSTYFILLSTDFYNAASAKSLGNYVEIGSLTTIVSGTIEPTVIEEYAFIDDLNHIAHNCKIGRSAMLTGMCEVSGSVELGEKCYLAPRSCIRNGVKVGKGSFIGQMTLVTKDVPAGSTIAGNPGEDVARMKIWREIQKELIEDRISNDKKVKPER